MSSLEEKQRKLEELRAKRKLMKDKKSTQAPTPKFVPGQNYEDQENSPQKQDNQIQLKGLSMLDQEPDEPVKIQNYVTVINIPSKKKPYTVQQGCQVNKADIQKFIDMEREAEEAPVYEQIQDQQEDLTQEEQKKKRAHKVYNEKEQEQVFKGERFKRFLRKNSQEMEDQLNTSYTLVDDILNNADQEFGEDYLDKMTHTLTLETKDAREQYMVPQLQWCQMKAEWLLGNYYIHEEQAAYQSGMGLIWSLENKQTPVHEFFSQKRINRMTFSNFDENILFGGLINGQVVMWDVRESKKQPVKKSRPSTEAHGTAVYGLNLVDDKYIITLSTEGKFCVWDQNVLVDPISSFIVSTNVVDQSGRISIDELPLAPTTTLSYSDSLYAASFDKRVFRYSNEDIIKNQLPAAAEQNQLAFESHKAPVTTMSISKYQSAQLSHQNGLLITGSFDYSINLWKSYTPSNMPLYTFDFHEDYITSVDWNPVKPGMFTSCDCSGGLVLWDLLDDRDYPSFHNKIDPIMTSCWHPDGQTLAIGGTNGAVELYGLKKKYLRVSQELLEDYEETFNL